MTQVATTKLFPPILEASLPAFYQDANSKRAVITVPFTMNAAVAKGDVKKMVMIIKNVQNSSLITNAIESTTMILNGFDSSATFEIKDVSVLNVGEYYKIQIAFVDQKGIVGNYSQVGVARFTYRAIVSLNTPTSIGTTELLKGIQIYKGIYQCDDPLEKEYSYKFSILNSSNEELYTTGEQIHNVSNDENNKESYDIWQFDADFAEVNEVLYATYEVKTVHGLIYKTVPQKLLSNYGCPPDDAVIANLHLKASFNEEDGAVEIYADSNNQEINGFFILKRSKRDEKGRFFIYEAIETFGCNRAVLRNSILCQDLTVESGQTYRYRVQQFNSNGVYSTFLPIENSVSITPYYEDMFLYDGERQLRIRFNPQVSSFKSDILMTKTDTIGNRYPHIFRNGIVNYKEFPINGLISYQMDPNEKFCSKAELGLYTGITQRGSTNTKDNNFYDPIKPGDQVAENIEAERRFKMKVLDFLNNGKNKLFRSPTEGNFLVQLMNVSLSPQQSLARMIHSFQCTAYEIGPASNLTSILRAQTEGYEASATRLWFSTMNDKAFKTFSIKDKNNAIKYGEQIYELLFQDFIPGTIFTLDVVKNGKTDTENIIIGGTGAYHYLANSNNTYISGLYFDNEKQFVLSHSGKRGTQSSIADYLAGGSITAPAGRFMMVSKFNNITGYTIEENFGEIIDPTYKRNEREFKGDNDRLTAYQWLTGSADSVHEYTISSIPLVRALNKGDRAINFLWTSSPCAKQKEEGEWKMKKNYIRENIFPQYGGSESFISKIKSGNTFIKEIEEETYELLLGAICKLLPSTVCQNIAVVRSIYKKFTTEDNKIKYRLTGPKRSADFDEEYLDDVYAFLGDLCKKLGPVDTFTSLGDYHMVTLLPNETRELIVQGGPEIQNLAFIYPKDSYQVKNLDIEIYSAGVQITRASNDKGGVF